MSHKWTAFIFALTCSALTLFCFCHDLLSADAESTLDKMASGEKIVDEDRRAVLRAFYTAPPVILHEIGSRDSKDCLRCHLRVTRIDDTRVAMETPHPQFSNCLQCHVPSLPGRQAGEPGGNQETGNSWEGLKEPKRGDRWFTISPPTVPHRIVLRENCLSCHGPENPDTRIRTPHPQRTSCLQCHVPGYQNEFEAE